MLAACALAGCGSAPDSELPPPAQPAKAPPLTEEPKGVIDPSTVHYEPAWKVDPDAPPVVEQDGPPATDPTLGPNQADAGDGRLRGTLDTRKRTLTVVDKRTGERQSVPAGVGPAQLVSEADRFYVTDATGNGLLVFQTKPELRLTRRVALPGTPFTIAADNKEHDLYVVLSARNELVQLPAHGQPFVRRRFKTVRGVHLMNAWNGTVLMRGTDQSQQLGPRDTQGEPQG